MHDPVGHTEGWRRALVAVAAAAVALGVAGFSTITGSARADERLRAIDGSSPNSLPPFVFSIPPHTFVVADPNAADPTTTTAETTTTADTTTTTETTTTTTMHETTTSTSEAPTVQAGPSSAEPEYSLVIDLAQVNCDGTIHVEYTTTAEPAPPGPANHIVMYNPTSSPTAFTVVETPDNPANGSFAFDGAGAPDLTYRVFVIGLFDPANPDGPKVIDQADVVLTDGC